MKEKYHEINKSKITLKFEYIYTSLFLLTFLILFNEIETQLGALSTIVITSFIYFYKEKIYGKQFSVLFIYLFHEAFLYTGFFSIKSLSQNLDEYIEGYTDLPILKIDKNINIKKKEVNDLFNNVKTNFSEKPWNDILVDEKCK